MLWREILCVWVFVMVFVLVLSGPLFPRQFLLAVNQNIDFRRHNAAAVHPGDLQLRADVQSIYRLIK